LEKLSLLGKKWIFPREKSEGNFLQKLKKIRGIESSEIHSGKKMYDLVKAVVRIRDAIGKNERILVVGDYDADGVTAATILFKTIHYLGGIVSVRLPHRVRDGYGLNTKFIEEAKNLEVKLIVTVDNGISAVAEIKLAREFGIDVIITDHHAPPEILPSAFAIVNPRQKNCEYLDKNLSGAEVAMKLAENLGDLPSDLKNEILVLAMIGTLADVCPLVGENREIVAAGLAVLPKIKNIGLQKILANTGLNSKISAEDIGFRVAPRLNAAGRLGDPLTAFQALAHNEGERFVDELERLNYERKNFTVKVLDEVEERLGELGAEKILIASGDFHLGIIGLVAANLAEKYFRPVIVMGSKDENFIGSCRSPLPEFDITEALSECTDLLEKFGGHRAAAGFTVSKKNRAEFEKRITNFANSKIQKIGLIPKLEIDFKIEENVLTEKFLTELNSLAPFGAGNSEPKFFWKNALLAEIQTIGAESKHLKMRVGLRKLTAVAFRFGEFVPILKKQKTADLVFNFGENVWNGSRELQLKIVDAR